MKKYIKYIFLNYTKYHLKLYFLIVIAQLWYLSNSIFIFIFQKWIPWLQKPLICHNDGHQNWRRNIWKRKSGICTSVHWFFAFCSPYSYWTSNFSYRKEVKIIENEAKKIRSNREKSYIAIAISLRNSIQLSLVTISWLDS